MALISAPSGFYPIEKAKAVAAEYQAADPDWTYEVVDCGNGYGRIDAYDEDGELVETAIL